jgi:hypothetical protein
MAYEQARARGLGCFGGYGDLGLDLSSTEAAAGIESADLLMAAATQSTEDGGDGAAHSRRVGVDSTRACGVLHGTG